jgi:hypothetical protein
VREQLMNRHLLSDVFAVIGQVIRDLRIELDLSLLDQLHRQRRRELLRDRAQAKLRVRRIRYIPFHVREPKPAFVNNLPILCHEGRAIELLVLVREGQHLLNFRSMVLGQCRCLETNQKDCGKECHS